MREKQRVFLDTCCVMSAAISNTGGSHRIFELAAQGCVDIVLTEHVARSAVRHLNAKYRKKEAKELLKLLSEVTPETCDDVSEDEESRWDGITDDNDRHILAGALKAEADVLISWDETHVVTEKVSKEFPIPVMTPQQFCNWFLERDQLGGEESQEELDSGESEQPV